MQTWRSFRQVDYAVIAVLYVGDIVDVWTGGWVTFAGDVLFGAEGNNGGVSSSKRGIVRIQNADPTFSAIALGNSISVLFVKCALCLSLAFTADLRNRKFLWYFGSLCLWVLTPIVGIVTVLTRSSALALSLSWLAAVLFVTSPLKYCLMFNQRLNPSRDQTRLVVALFEFMIASCTFLLHTCHPNPKNVHVSTLVAVWAAVIIPLGIIVILLTIAIRNHCTSEIPKERSFKELGTGIRQDAMVKSGDAPGTAFRQKTAPLRFVMFALLLCPVIAVTITLEGLGKITREAKLERSLLQFYGAVTSLVAIPVISLVVSLCRGTRGTFWDYMVLALAHVLNTVIMLLIYLHFRRADFSNDLIIPPTNQSADPTSLAPITKEIPGAGMAVVRVYFPGSPPPSKKYFFQSSLNGNPKEVLFVSELVPVKGGSLKYDFSVWEDGSRRLNQSLLVRERRRYFFVVTGTLANLTELIYVPNVRDFTPENGECILVMSSIAEGFGSVLAKKGVFTVLQQGKVIRSFQIPQTNSSIQWCVPAENTTFRFEIRGLSIVIQFNKELQPYREYLLLVSWRPETFNGYSSVEPYVVTWYNVSDSVSRTRTLLEATNGLGGVMAVAAKIGYVQFFWLEAPVRLRTTLFACTLVANEVAAWLADLLFEEIREKISLALLILSAIAGLVHVVLGAFYDFKLRKNL